MSRFLVIAAAIAATFPIFATGPILVTGNAAEPPAAARKADLADRIAGTYQGSVISDARGSSRDKVTITVTRTGANRVEIKSSYPRIPTVTITVERAMNAILAASGPHVLLVNLADSPDRLDLTIDDASWSGTRAAK